MRPPSANRTVLVYDLLAWLAYLDHHVFYNIGERESSNEDRLDDCQSLGRFRNECKYRPSRGRRSYEQADDVRSDNASLSTLFESEACYGSWSNPTEFDVANQVFVTGTWMTALVRSNCGATVCSLQKDTRIDERGRYDLVSQGVNICTDTLRWVLQHFSASKCSVAGCGELPGLAGCVLRASTRWFIRSANSLSASRVICSA